MKSDPKVCAISVEDFKRQVARKMKILRAAKARQAEKDAIITTQALIKMGFSEAQAKQFRIPRYGAIVIKPISGHCSQDAEYPRSEKAFHLIDKEAHKKFFDAMMRARK